MRTCEVPHAALIVGNVSPPLQLFPSVARQVPRALLEVHLNINHRKRKHLDEMKGQNIWYTTVAGAPMGALRAAGVVISQLIEGVFR